MLIERSTYIQVDNASVHSTSLVASDDVAEGAEAELLCIGGGGVCVGIEKALQHPRLNRCWAIEQIPAAMLQAWRLSWGRNDPLR